MSSATSNAQALPEGLEFYRVRDDIARDYNPVGALELMLVTQIAQAWLCLQRAYETQRRYFQAHDVLEAIATQFNQYKAVTREVTNCERIWRHAILHLEKRQRQRRRDNLGLPEFRRTSRHDQDSNPPTTPGHRAGPTPAAEHPAATLENTTLSPASRSTHSYVPCRHSWGHCFHHNPCPERRDENTRACRVATPVIDGPLAHLGPSNTTGAHPVESHVAMAFEAVLSSAPGPTVEPTNVRRRTGRSTRERPEQHNSMEATSNKSRRHRRAQEDAVGSGDRCRCRR